MSVARGKDGEGARSRTWESLAERRKGAPVEREAMPNEPDGIRAGGGTVGGKASGPCIGANISGRKE